MRRSRFWCAVAIAIATGTPALAWNLRPPFTVDNAQVLPRGVRNPRFIQMYFDESDKFGVAGAQEPVGAKLNRQVLWEDVLASQSDEPARNQLRSVIGEPGLAGTDGPGRATGIVHAFLDVKAPALAWGITEKLTLAVAVPIVHADVKVDTGFEASETGQRFIDEVGKRSPERANDAAAKLNAATVSKLDRLGYEPLRSQTFSGVGDVQLVGKYQLMQAGGRALAAKMVLSLPTGSSWNPDRVLDIPTGEGRFIAGMYLVHDWEVFSDARWNVYGGYASLMATDIVRRLPASDTDSLSADKERLNRRRADQVATGTSLDYRFRSLGLTVGAGYNFQFRGGSKYQGSAADAATQLRYRYLENLEPTQFLHSATGVVSFSTIDFYRRKQFPLPLQLSVVYSRPFAGRNVPTSGILAGELMAFF